MKNDLVFILNLLTNNTNEIDLFRQALKEYCGDDEGFAMRINNTLELLKVGGKWCLTHIVKSMMKLNQKTMTFLPMGFGYALNAQNNKQNLLMAWNHWIMP